MKARRRIADLPSIRGEAIPANLTRYEAVRVLWRLQARRHVRTQYVQKLPADRGIQTGERTDVVVVVSSPSWGPPRHSTPRVDEEVRMVYYLVLGPCAPHAVSPRSNFMMHLTSTY